MSFPTSQPKNAGQNRLTCWSPANTDLQVAFTWHHSPLRQGTSKALARSFSDLQAAKGAEPKPGFGQQVG